MTTTLTGVASNGYSLFLSLPTDGTDHRTAASLYPAHQRAADNFAYTGANCLFKNSGTFTLSTPLTINGATVTFSLAVQINGALGLAAGAVVAGGISSDNIANSGNATFATASFSGVVTHTGAARVRRRRATLADADATITIGTADFFAAPTLSAARAILLGTSGAAQGDELEIFNGVAAHAINVSNGAGVIATVQNGGGGRRSARFMFDPIGTGDWVCVSEENA